MPNLIIDYRKRLSFRRRYFEESATILCWLFFIGLVLNK